MEIKDLRHHTAYKLRTINVPGLLERNCEVVLAYDHLAHPNVVTRGHKVLVVHKDGYTSAFVDAMFLTPA